MQSESMHPAIARLLADEHKRLSYEWLASDLRGSDLTSLLLAVLTDRANDRSASDLLRQYDTDRFVAPGQVDALQLARTELMALETASPDFDVVRLSPVVPFGLHSVLSTVPQNNVVTTSRLSEVTADPTNALALEACVRRVGRETVRLAAVHRVIRAQHFEGPRSFAHFSLLGLVSAGRDVGNGRFEADELHKQIERLSQFVTSATGGTVRVLVTSFAEPFAEIANELVASLKALQIDAGLFPERTHGRGYYRSLGFKLYVRVGDDEFEVGDGGDVDWTQELLQSQKERFVISGVGVDRVVMLQPAGS